MTNDEILIMYLRTIAAGQCSLRDRIATEAMYALVVRSGGADADYAYRIADAMLEARAIQPTPAAPGNAQEVDTP